MTYFSLAFHRYDVRLTYDVVYDSWRKPIRRGVKFRGDVPHPSKQILAPVRAVFRGLPWYWLEKA